MNMDNAAPDGGAKARSDPRSEDAHKGGLFTSSWGEGFQKDTSTLAFAVGILVGVLTLVLIFVWRKGKVKRDAILITGPSNAGKTLLFYQMTHGLYIDTYTSMVANVDLISFDTSNALFRLVDLPGSDKLRAASVEKYRDAAKAVIFLVDSSTIKQHLRDSAEFLFKLLSDPVLHKNRVPFLVVCNKQDLGLTAKGAKVVERELTKEMGLLRETHARLLVDTDGQENRGSVYLGHQGKDFEFSHLPNKVEFLESSLTLDQEEDKSGIPRIRDWLANTL